MESAGGTIKGEIQEVRTNGGICRPQAPSVPHCLQAAARSLDASARAISTWPISGGRLASARRSSKRAEKADGNEFGQALDLTHY
jgi:hypothetical protein